MIKYYHLELFETAPHAVLLGYPLLLSKIEHRVLVFVCRKHPIPISIDSLANELGLTENCLAVHICSLNKKAARISGRRLLVFDGGYRLNELM